jgi:hypothetical protein
MAGAARGERGRTFMDSSFGVFEPYCRHQRRSVAPAPVAKRTPLVLVSQGRRFGPFTESEMCGYSGPAWSRQRDDIGMPGSRHGARAEAAARTGHARAGRGSPRRSCPWPRPASTSIPRASATPKTRPRPDWWWLAGRGPGPVLHQVPVPLSAVRGEHAGQFAPDSERADSTRGIAPQTAGVTPKPISHGRAWHGCGAACGKRPSGRSRLGGTTARQLHAVPPMRGQQATLPAPGGSKHGRCGAVGCPARASRRRDGAEPRRDLALVVPEVVANAYKGDYASATGVVPAGLASSNRRTSKLRWADGERQMRP